MFIGTDIVHTPRFISWIDYPRARLSPLFTDAEYDVFKQRKQELSHHALPSEKKAAILSSFLAGRFAAKEASYKAISQYLAAQGATSKSFSFKAWAPHVATIPVAPWHLPTLIINNAGFHAATGVSLPPLRTQVSLAHDGEYTVAQVLLTDSL